MPKDILNLEIADYVYFEMERTKRPIVHLRNSQGEVMTFARVDSGSVAANASISNRWGLRSWRGRMTS